MNQDQHNAPEDERTDEEKRLAVIKRAARQDVIASANLYIETRNRDLLVHIQEIVDALDDAFVLVIPQKDGVPYSVTFNPREAVPEVPLEDERAE